MKLPRKSISVFLLILLVYAVYAGIYIYRTSFVVDGVRYFVLFDDAMVSMRYAQNLAHGEGLVWNACGERVEGLTNPLWTVFMAFFHLFPIPNNWISLALQICGGLFFIASLFFTKKIADEVNPGSFVPLLAVFLTAFYGQLSTWSLLGMEVNVLLLITGRGVWMAIRGLRTGRFSPGLYVLLGVGTLVRMDMAVPFGAILIYMVFADVPNRKRHLFWGLGSFAAFMGGQTLLRLWYYGELLPNTYYLKVTGAPLLLILKHGIYVFIKFVWNFNTALFVLPFLLILVRQEKSTLLLAWVFAGFCAYSICVGGDAWESKGGANRFISTGIPLFFVLLAYSFEMVREALVKSQKFIRGYQHSCLGRLFQAETLSKVALVAFVFVGLVNLNALVDTHSLKYWLLLERHPFIAGSERYVRIARVVNEMSMPQATVAVVTAGIIPYFSERPAIDLLGKNDKVVARGPMHIPPDLRLSDLRPGHMKWNYAHSLATLKPDIVAQLYGGYNNPETLQYIKDYTKVNIKGFPFFLLNNSPYILWDAIRPLEGD
jgi:hypothetical protein